MPLVLASGLICSGKFSFPSTHSSAMDANRLIVSKQHWKQVIHVKNNSLQKKILFKSKLSCFCCSLVTYII